MTILLNNGARLNDEARRHKGLTINEVAWRERQRSLSLLNDEALRERGILFSPVHRWRLIKSGKFPKPVKLGGGRNAWVEKEIDDWIAARIAARDEVEGGITSNDLQPEETINLAAEWLQKPPADTGHAIISELKQRFGITTEQALEAICTANLRRQRAA